MPIHQIILKEPMYTESEVHELKDIIKTQENYINKTLRNDSDKVSKEIKKLRDALEEIRDRIPEGQIGLPYKIAYEALKESE